MKVSWSPQAHADLDSLRAYIAEDSPAAARRTALRIVDLVEGLLPANPHVGRGGRVPGTRELVIPKTPYIVAYRVRTNVLEILGMYHGARRWPDRF